MAIGSGVFAFLGSVQSNYLMREEHLVIQIIALKTRLVKRENASPPNDFHRS